MTVEDKTASMMLVPPAPGLCQECATEHDPDQPHNAESIYYSVKFNMEHGRAPTWRDAMAHCDERVQEFWITELKKLGRDV